MSIDTQSQRTKPFAFPRVYQPSVDLRAKVSRRLARYWMRDIIAPELQRGLISFTFDDCPRSVVEHALPRLEAKGWHATIYACVGLCDTTNHLGLHMSETDLQDANYAGHDIADHTFSHLDARQVGREAMLVDIAENKAAFKRLDLPPATSFAFPYGEVTPLVKQALSRQFPLCRGIHTPQNATIDLALAPAARLYSSEIDATLEQIEIAAREKRWLTLFGHDVRDNPSDYGCTPDELQIIIDAIAAHDLDVLTVRNALKVVKP